MDDIEILHIKRLDFTFSPKPWPFAAERRAEIDAYFVALQRERPAIWNGRVLVMYDKAHADGVFSGRFLETDFASFVAWSGWGRPPAGIIGCFGAAGILAADGAFLLGVMGAHTANAGHIYFPCGTPDAGDIVDGKVDFDVSVRRELKEETGLDISEFDVEPGWTTVIAGARIANIKVLRSAENAETLRARILRHLASERQPELSDIYIVRRPADFDAAMPPYITAFLRWHFAGSGDLPSAPQ